MKQIQSWLHDNVLHGIIAIVIFLLSYIKLLVADNIDLFVAIFWVVALDWVFGVAIAIKKDLFETRKALKVIWYLASYWMVLFMVLSVEKAYPAAFFLSEAVVLPILIFQIISSLKNASLLGIIPKGLLLQILKKVDNHKEQSITETK